MPDAQPEAAAPEWFTRALAVPYEDRFVHVAGCEIHYMLWGDKRSPSLLLIPGGGGHAHWFAHVAPLLADQFHVAAIDIAGTGESGRREAYTSELVTAEIMAVCQDAGMLSGSVRPTLVGHSIGGQFAVRAAIAHGEALLGVIAVDALRYAKLPTDSAVAALDRPAAAPRPPRSYPDRETALARFRLQPEPRMPINAGFILDHIACHSIRPVDGGWASKYDNGLAAVISLGLELKDRLQGLQCSAAAVYGEYTHLADATVVEKMTEATCGEVPIMVIPGTSHYPMIDSPFAFVAAIKGLSLAWIAALRRAR